jgi:hypothetical protein
MMQVKVVETDCELSLALGLGQAMILLGRTAMVEG